MTANSSDPKARESIKKQVYHAIQQVRSDANAELMRASWLQLFREKRPLEKPLRTGDKLSYWLLVALAWLCVLIFTLLSFLRLMGHDLPGYIILLSFGMLGFGYNCYLSQTIKYKPDSRAIDNI